MARIRSTRWWVGLTAIFASVFLGTVATLTFWNWPHAADPGPEPSIVFITASPAPTVVNHPAPLDAKPLTQNILRSVNDGWILTEYDSSAGLYAPPSVLVTPSPGGSATPSPVEVLGDGPWEWEIPGTTYIYAVDPSGAVYEAADLGVGTDVSLDLWLPDLRTAIVEEPVIGGTALRTLDLVTGDLSEPFPGPGGSSSGVWREPVLRLANDGEGIWVSFEEESGARGLNLINLDGEPEAALVRPGYFGGFIESSDGGTVITVEGVSGPGWSIVSYSVPGTSIYPEPTAEPSTSPTSEPTPAASPTSTSPYGPAAPTTPLLTITPDGYERVAHGMPPGEEDCFPASWPEDRQLLIACVHENGALVLYTLALVTSTFVDVATFPAVVDESALLVNRDGTRIVRGAAVVNPIGDTVWTLPSARSRPTGLVWAGDYLVTWGDSQSPPDPGYGASALYVWHASQGDSAYVLKANRGASGFAKVIPAPPIEAPA